MKNDALEAVETMPEVVPAHENGGEGIGDGEDEEIVVAQRLADIAVEECMKGTLKTACRTRSARAQAPRTLYGEMLGVGIDKVIE